MTIAFLNPPWWLLENNQLRQGIRAGSRWPFTRQAPYMPDQYRFGAYSPFPFFMAQAAAYVAQHFDGKALFRDSVARGESYPAFLLWMATEAPDCVVIETGAAAWDHDLALIKHLKAHNPKLRVAVAGPTAASGSKSTEPGVVDAWLLGEYEKNALLFAEGANGVLGFNLLTRQEMDDLPYPMFDEDCSLNYWDACPKGQRSPHLQLFASRGCYYKCCFCAWPATMTSDDPDGTKPRSVRFYKPEWLEGFIRHRLSVNPDIQSIYFDDDSWNLNEKHNLQVCEVMKRIGLPWSAMCRADNTKPETWKAMKDAGCFGVKLGFESGSQRVIDEIVGKKLDLRKAEATARWLRSVVGMTVHGTFTVGLPGETKEEAQQTINFIEELYKAGGLDTHQLSGTATIEGTPLDRISHGEALAVFPGAKAGAEFVVSHDGVLKLEGMK